MCYTRKSSLSEAHESKVAGNRTDEMRTKRTGPIDALPGNRDKHDEKAAPERAPAKETVPAE